jgi:hypothetical protein
MSTSKFRFLKRFLAAVTSLAVVTTIVLVVAGIVMSVLNGLAVIFVLFCVVGAK